MDNTSSFMELGAFLKGGFQPQRYRPDGVADWSGHLPFAHDLTVAARPELFVELGTYYGESYFGFCQAVRENAIDCSCYAVDPWVREAKAGAYAENVFRDVHAYNSAHYADFSYLLRTTFDEAIAKFDDESVDVLHIDGPNTYQAISHDLRSWIGKVKPGGIVLIHNIMVRAGDFGDWKAWEELASTGKQFIFRHSLGLGVFRKAGCRVPDNGMFAILFDSSPETKEHVRRFYSLCATRLEYEHQGENRPNWAEGQIAARAYPFDDSGYRPEPESRAADRERDSLSKERNALLEQRKTMAQQQDAALTDFRKLQGDLYVCRTDLKKTAAEEDRLRTEFAHSQQLLESVLASLSWRVTAPIRKFTETIRGRR